MHPTLQRNRRLLRWTCCAGITLLQLACATNSPTPVPTVVIRQPCLAVEQLPDRPTMTFESSPATDDVALVRALVVDREALLAYQRAAHPLLTGCAQ